MCLLGFIAIKYRQKRREMGNEQAWIYDICKNYRFNQNKPFGNFCVPIGQFFEAQWVFEVCFDKSLLPKDIVAYSGNLPNG